MSHQSLPILSAGVTGRGNAQLIAPTEISSVSTLNEIFAYARKEKASDVHLSSMKPVIFRYNGQLKNITTDLLSADQIQNLLKTGLPQEIMDSFMTSGDIEYVHTLQGYGRFRVTLIKQRNGYDLTARLIPLDIPNAEQIGLPPSCANLTKWAQGLVLITGPAGCGKTTSLAALVDIVNQNRHDHIITIEQPVEIVYEPKKCQITQREVNLHTLSQDNALRAALREDPDILAVSELRDLATIQYS